MSPHLADVGYSRGIADMTLSLSRQEQQDQERDGRADDAGRRGREYTSFLCKVKAK